MKAILSGNEAVARGAFEAGIQVATGYPGTPSTEILEALAAGDEYKDMYLEWSPNEKVALEVASGASLGGARTITTMKHVGLNVAADPYFSQAYVGVNGGMIVVSADDPSMHSSQNEQDNRNLAKAAKTPCLEPADSQEAKDFVKIGIEISERFDMPVMLRLTTRICHSKSVVDFNDPEKPEKKPLSKDFKKNVVIPKHAYVKHVELEKRLEELSEYACQLPINNVEYKNTDIGIISSGVAYQYAKEVFPEASFLKLGLVNPLPKKLIKEFADKVKEVIIVEEVDPVIEEQVRAMGIKVTGKDKLPKCHEYNINVLEEKLINKELPESAADEVNLPPRPPVLCGGCPHRGAFFALKRLKAYVTGDIGCYTLGGLPPLNALHTCLDMGASIGHAIGISKTASEEVKGQVVAAIGDSTFIHSGITGLIDAVYQQADIVVMIMDNSITAMTGHQQNPSTGHNIRGEKTKQVDLKEICKACGVESVREVTAFNFKDVQNIFKEEFERKGPSVVITKGPCIFVDPNRRHFPNYFEVDPEKCRFCKACFQIGCPAISIKNEKSYIDPFLCTGCSVCAQVCPFHAIEKKERGK